MAVYGDLSAYYRQLKLTNYAESLESEPRHHVRRISFVSTILEDEFGADDVVKPLSPEDQDVLSWQARTENLQNDAEVREDLTRLSGRLCPYKNISLTLSGKVTDRDSHQPRIEPHPLSAYRHVSFRCAMLTDHSTSDGQVQLLFLYDGLRDRDFLRWRSHDYIKLVLLEARPSYRVFWLVQWDIVDKLDPISDGQTATTGPGIMNWWPCLDRLAVDCQGGLTEKVPNGFHGIRRRDAKRKSPWIAEVRPKGNRGSRADKIWLGSYPTPEAAARAADAGHYYYNHQNRLENRFNFLDSPSHLQQIPRDLNDKDMKEFVIKEARRLARIPPSGCIPENQSYNRSWAQGFTSPQPPHICCGNNCSSGRKQLAANGNFVEALPRLDNFTAPLMDSGRNLKKNLPSTSYCSDVWQEVVGSSPDENQWLWSSNGNFTDTSQVSAGVLNPRPEQTDVCEPLAVLSYPEENAEPDISNEIAWGGLSDANDSGLHRDPLTGISETRSCNTNTGGFTSRNISSANNFGDHNGRPVTNVSFTGLPSARPDGFAIPSMDSGRDLQANLVDVRPSTSFGSGVFREPVARTSPEENLLLATSNNRFTSNSLVTAGAFYPKLEPTYTHEASLAPVGNSSSGKATNDFFNLYGYIHDTAWDENLEQDIPDDSDGIRVSDIPSVLGVSDSNHLGLHQEIESHSTNLTSPGYDFNPLVAGSEQAESNGDNGRDTYPFDWAF